MSTKPAIKELTRRQEVLWERAGLILGYLVATTKGNGVWSMHRSMGIAGVEYLWSDKDTCKAWAHTLMDDTIENIQPSQIENQVGTMIHEWHRAVG